MSNVFERSLSDDKDQGYSRSVSLSALYGVILVLLGCAVSVSEGIASSILTPHLVAVLMSYLYAGSSIFVLYFHIHEGILKRNFYNDKVQEKEEKLDEHMAEAYKNLRRNIIQQAKDVAEQSASSMSSSKTSSIASIEFRKHSSLSASSNDNDDIDGGEPSFRTRIRFHQSIEEVKGMGRNRSANFAGHRRFSVMPFSSAAPENQTPDDVYNYIADKQGTATITGEGTNFFMKAGSLTFAIANLVYTALRIEGEHRLEAECGTSVLYYQHYMHLIFIVLQTFFLLKDCHFVMRTNKVLVRFGLMHLVATNLCVWMRFLVLEVVESIEHLHLAHETGHHVEKRATSSVNKEDSYNEGNETACPTIPPVMFQAGPYLFPFVLEYSLVAMNAAAFMFSSLNIKISTELYKAVCSALQSKGEQSEKKKDDKNQEEQPFDKSNLGLFLGALCFAAVVISMVLFFYLDTRGDKYSASFCYALSEILLLLSLLAGTTYCIILFWRFQMNLNVSNTYDHMLLLLSVSFYVLLDLFKIISTCNTLGSKDSDDRKIASMNVVVNLLSIMQSVGQSAFIVDGMQRVAVKEKDKERKSGRGIITFLIIANVAAWVFKSFQEKKADFSSQYEFFGDVGWTLISSISLPMILFYRFHSSICLAHMWHFCYEPQEKELMESKILN